MPLRCSLSSSCPVQHSSHASPICSQLPDHLSRATFLLLASLVRTRRLTSVSCVVSSSIFDHFPAQAYFWVSMADQLDIDVSLSRSPTLLMAIHLTFIVISPWLLLNLLIAMMGQTFEKSAEDTQRTWIFPFASLVLMYEKGLLERERREPSGMYRSGKFAGNEDDVKRDKDLYWKSVFYEIEVRTHPCHLACCLCACIFV